MFDELRQEIKGGLVLVSEVGDSLVFMKIKMISWNVRGLNDPQK